VQLRVDADELEIRPARPRYRLNALVRGMTPQNRHADTDWGTAQGREVW
jgi:antitoxin component of MazEF toxin-antitoxin module